MRTLPFGNPSSSKQSEVSNQPDNPGSLTRLSGAGAIVSAYNSFDFSDLRDVRATAPRAAHIGSGIATPQVRRSSQRR